MEEQKYNGISIDTRSREETILDTKFEEVVTKAAPVIWVEKDPQTWPVYSIRNQDGSSSCVAQTMAKIAEVLNQDGTVFSASDMYEDRVNKPGEGMIAYDVFNLAGRGIATEKNMPSQNMTEDQMNTAPRSAQALTDREIIKIGKRVDLPIKDIDSVASVMQTTGKPVMVWFFANSAEWNQDVPQILDPNLTIGNATIVHSLTGITFTLWKGEKAIVIDESWGKFGKFVGRRVITESFFKARNFYAGYPMNFKLKGDISHNFQTDLQFGMRDNDDVKALQAILQHEGMFPLNFDFTGNYLSETAKGVYAFQMKYQVAPQAELDNIIVNGIKIKGGRVGPKTRAKLNELYNK